MLLDEKRVIKINLGGEEITLDLSFKSLKRLAKIDNPFELFSKFATDENGDRLELLPSFILAMSDREFTKENLLEKLNEIESQIGFSYARVIELSNIIYEIVFSEIMDNSIKADEAVEDKAPSKPKPKSRAKAK